jgi:RNA 2',3'-cyclic 3'-phosphodiesterase
MRTVRTFVAVEISPEVRSRAAQLIARFSPTSAKVKWVDPHNLHMTLKFLGEVDLREAPQVCAAVGEATADLPPFSIRVAGAGAFPDLHHPRTVWLGVTEGADEMVALHERLEASLATLGFRREQRRFRPHLTIGRVRGLPGAADLEQLIARYQDFDAGLADVDEVVVFSSELNRDGPTYEPLSTAPLTGD